MQVYTRTHVLCYTIYFALYTCPKGVITLIVYMKLV